MTFAPGLLQIFWISFLAAGLASYPIYKALLALKSRQTVSQYAPEGHQVKQGTPTMGGIIIIFGLLVGGFGIALLHYGDPGSRIPSYPLLSGFLLAASFALIGFVDDFVVPRIWKDKRGLGWKQKIVLELVFSVVALLPSYGQASALIWIVTVFSILFFANAYNFSDGLDGLAGTLLLTMSVGLLGVAAAGGLGVSIGLWSAALIGAVLPFLFYNAPPAKLFMGDVGSLGIGALLGFLGVQAVGQAADLHWLGAEEIRFHDAVQSPWIIAFALLIWSVVMIVSLVPVPLQIASVKLFKKKIFLYTPIHHAFEKIGWKETRIVGFYALVQLLLSLLAISIVTFVSTSIAVSFGAVH